MLIDIKIRQIIEHIVGVNHIRDFTNHMAHIEATQRPIDTAKTRGIFALRGEQQTCRFQTTCGDDHAVRFQRAAQA